jgi:hypothetical protein
MDVAFGHARDHWRVPLLSERPTPPSESEAKSSGIIDDNKRSQFARLIS